MKAFELVQIATGAVISTVIGADDPADAPEGHRWVEVTGRPKRLAVVDAATGRVVGEWSGGVEQDLVVPQGQIAIDVSGRTESVSGQRWTGTAFEPMPPPPVRTLSALDFARRFTLAEGARIDALADTDRTVKAWMRRLNLTTRVHLDHPDVIAGLSYLKSVGIPALWPDAATADRRIAEIRGVNDDSPAG